MPSKLWLTKEQGISGSLLPPGFRVKLDTIRPLSKTKEMLNV